MTPDKAIEGCKKQDRICQKYLFDAYADAMLMVCMRYVKTLPDAEELMQNGFYSFFKSIDRFIYSWPESIGAWLRKIMVNECLMFLRRKGVLKIVNEAYAGEVAAAGNVADDMQAGEIWKVVLTLPAGYRTVFNLFVVEGYSHREIAGLLDITEGTSKSQLSKARTMLQELMRQNGCYYEQ